MDVEVVEDAHEGHMHHKVLVLYLDYSSPREDVVGRTHCLGHHEVADFLPPRPLLEEYAEGGNEPCADDCLCCIKKGIQRNGRLFWVVEQSPAFMPVTRKVMKRMDLRYSTPLFSNSLTICSLSLHFLSLNTIGIRWKEM